MQLKPFPFLFFTLIIAACNQTEKKENTTPAQTDRFIKPPINNVDVSYKEYSVDAEKGDTLNHQTGSIILFPPNSFIDKDGNLIKGNVQVKYREFTNPIDFYLSGVPMDYDSAGTKYPFESSGMCEILAYKDGIPVFVNPKNKPEIILVSNSNSKLPNLYYLDTVQKKWINRGASIVTELNNPKKENQFVNDDLTEPVKPEKANNKSPVIQIVVDPASFKELLVYDNLKFQLDSNERKYNDKDTVDEWKNVELLKGTTKGLYTIKFSNDKRTVSYSARPVLEGNDYDKALKIFEKNNRDFKKKINERMKKEKTDKEGYLKDSLQNQKMLEEDERTERLNKLIDARNKEIEKENEIIRKDNKRILEKNRFNRESVLRNFKIDQFGYWNCDLPIKPNRFLITASFKDKNGNLLDLRNIAVLYKSVNGVLRFNDNKILLFKDTDNMILGVYNGRFAYITYGDYNKLKITADTKEQTFTMTIVSEKDNNYEFIKKISEQ